MATEVAVRKAVAFASFGEAFLAGNREDLKGFDLWLLERAANSSCENVYAWASTAYQAEQAALRLLLCDAVKLTPGEMISAAREEMTVARKAE